MATTTNYSWSTPDDTALVKDGASAIRTLGSSVDTTLFSVTGGKNVGLQYITSVSLTGASVQINNCFSSAYDNYSLVFNGVVGSTGAGLVVRIGDSTVSTGYYLCQISGQSAYTGTTAIAANVNNGAQYEPGITFDGTARAGGIMTVESPFLSFITTIQSHGTDSRTGGAGNRTVSGFLNNTNSYTGIYIAPSGGTFSGGTVRIYGYRN